MAESDEYLFEWRGDFDDASMRALHADAHDGEPEDHGWEGRVRTHSLGWVCARDDGGLIGFVNVAWDGAMHAFVLDTMVAKRARRRGVGTRLVASAAAEARAAGCEWLHVDFEGHLRGFYFDACGFGPTDAGLMALRGGSEPGSVSQPAE